MNSAIIPPVFNMEFSNMSQCLDVKKTVESTLDRAGSWILGKYPSSLNPDLDLRIDVRYPMSTVPSQSDSYNFSARPTCVIFQRGSMRVTLSRNASLSEKGWEKPAYMISIFTPYREKYKIYETLNGKSAKTEGNPFLLSALQKDIDFNHYISFFTKDEHENSKIATQKWNLTEMMIQSRER